MRLGLPGYQNTPLAIRGGILLSINYSRYFNRSYAQQLEKKLERIFWVSQIIRDRRFNDIPFGFVNGDIVQTINRL
jgi:hypothetical protein